MRKLFVLSVAIVLCVSAVAQTAKKTRRTASNSQAAVTERAISKRFNQGLRHYYTAQYEDALQSFSGILSDAPKHAPSFFMLSRVYEERQQFSDAENALKQAVKLDKNNIWYQIELARFYVNSANYKEATPMWEKICREFPDNTEYLTSLGICYTKTGASDKVAEVQSRLDLLTRQEDAESPSNNSVEVQDGSENQMAKGLAALKAQQYGQAVAFFENALRDDDTAYELWIMFAEAVAKSGQWHELTAREEDLTTLFPQSSVLLSALADAFLNDGQHEKAVAYFKQAMAFAFDADQLQAIRKGLYDAYTQLGDTQNAARYR